MKKETVYQRRGCSIFCKILHSLLLVLLAEMLLLIFAISTSRVTSQLNENAEDILDKQVENRANYLRQNLIQAQDLNAISGTIDGVTRELVDQGIVDLNTLDTSSEEALPLLQAIVPELVSTLRTKPVNGIFVILSTHDLNHRADDSYLPGLYIRDLDPSALSTDRNAALLMTDLDNLKTINDTYGHDWGDQYLRQTGRCLAASTPPGTLAARLSGDEFMLLLYGYDSREAVREELEKLRAALQDSASILPSGSELHISISGGVAWYPEDSTDFNTLKKYADFAMYQVKHSRKGEMKEFDIGMYNQEAYALQTRNEFEQMLRDQAVSYHFQPIFSARSGRAIAYEALMRPEMPTLRSPLTVMKLARELNRLYDIEHITLFKASSAFEKLKERGLVREDSLLFINSIASVSLNDTDWRDYRGRFPELARKLVVEITEEEELDPAQLERKRTMAGASGVFALDDYGSGYSNGSSLLTIAPRYVKVDISIIRSIDTNTDKQQFLTSLVDYARPRNILVLAEGVETTAELRKVLELGVDLLQGYCLARPAAVPPPLSKEAADIIHRMKRC